ncbi:DNAH [Acanthosepion pharaonis]|uniref:DNAH n=1 Tax=Acanthosepion pharaonis TaxID=158019 RepID=A0A812EAM4_ACAPH|nr:DNAH [Sepia pharaonis]
MKRIWSHLSAVKDKLYVDILGILKQIFPSVILYVEKEADLTFPKSHPKRSMSPRNPASSMSPRPLFLKSNLDIFSTKITLNEEMSLFPKAMTVLDLHRSIGSVAYDIAAYESFWGSCHGLTAQAVNVSLPEEVEPLLVLSGREAVEYYIKCQFLQKVEHLYFNLAPSHHFRPYHLVSVPKDKVNTEYYLFSSFGVLHVDKDLQSETFRLTEWQRHAVLWEAIHEIPFFKNYLISKMFYRWKAAQSYLLFLKTKESLERSLLQSMPIYEAGLLQVSNKSYTLPEFEEAVFQVQNDTKEYLKRFFRLCKIIVDVIMFESFKKLRFCEEQMTAKNMFSRDSLYLMKMKKKQRTANFLKAKNETR